MYFDGLETKEVAVADVELVTAADDAEAEPTPFAANSDLTRLRYVKSG